MPLDAFSPLKEEVEVEVQSLRGESIFIKIFQNHHTHDIETFSPFWKPAGTLIVITFN